MSEWFLGHNKPVSDMTTFVVIDTSKQPPRVAKAVYKGGQFYGIFNSRVDNIPIKLDTIAAWRKR